jgi:hypothetical protein
MLKRVTEGSIVLTIALGIALTIVQPQSIRRRLNSYNFGAGLDYGKTAALKHQKSGSIVSTKAFCLATANLQRSSRLFMDYM